MTSMTKFDLARFRPSSAVIAFLVACSVTIAVRHSVATVNAVPQTSQPLVQQQDLSYAGAFRLPQATSATQTFEWGGTGLAYWPAHDSLLVVGHDWYQQVGEVSIPTPGTGSSVTGLPRASLLQALTDITVGKLDDIDGADAAHPKIGGILPYGNQLIVSAWGYYDAGPPFQTKSHFIANSNFSAASASGPFQVGRGFQAIAPDTMRIAGFVSGYMAPIPGSWQAALGGTALTGQGGYISILTRTSAGPSASVFTPGSLGTTNPAPATIVMGYPTDGSGGGPLHHPTLGNWGQNGGLYNGTQGFRGMIFPEGTSSILYFGWGADQFCYGVGTDDPAKHLQPSNVPGRPYCYDPVPSAVGTLGTHGYPVKPIVWAYNANDFVAVKNGSKKPWDIRPYATWSLNLPFQSRIVNGIETGYFEIMGAAYDPVTKRVFVSAYRSDGAAPVIHVFSLNAGSNGAINRLCF
jgi:hypothetical protein